MNTNVRKNKINSLTGIRFYASFLVFVSHLELFNYFSEISDGLNFYFLKSFGTIGVSVFFALSGFILFVNYFSKGNQKRFSFRSFYVARFARVYPMFFISILFATPLVFLTKENTFSWFNFLVNISPLKYFFPQVSLINIPTWTIYVEGFFYSVFPFLGIALLKNQRSSIIIFILSFVIFVAATNIFMPNSDYITAGYFPVNRLLEFFSGMVIGYIYSYMISSDENTVCSEQYIAKFLKPLPTFLLVIIFCMPILSFYLFEVTNLPAKNFDFYFYFPFSLALILSIALLEKSKIEWTALTHPLITLGGELSYAFYLLHRPVLRYAVYILQNIFHVDVTKISMIQAIPIIIGIIFICFLLSYGCYQLIEKPCRRKINSFFLSKAS